MSAAHNKIVRLSPQQQMGLIRRKMSHLTMEWQPKAYIDLGAELNAVFGSPDLGFPCGKLIEIHGPESHGKSVISVKLQARAQQQRARIINVDFENSFDERWVNRNGLITRSKHAVPYSEDSDPQHMDRIYLLTPYVGTFGKEKTPRLSTAEELMDEAEHLIKYLYARNSERPIWLTVDSVTAMLCKEEGEAGIDGQNMRTKTSLASFMSRLLRRFTGIAQTNNCTMVWINQIRTAPGVMFGNPEYTPGGKALKFYCHSRVAVRRVKGGRLKKLGKVIGIKGVITNVKNKLGGVEGDACGYKIMFDGRERYLDANKLKKEE